MRKYLIFKIIIILTCLKVVAFAQTTVKTQTFDCDGYWTELYKQSAIIGKNQLRTICIDRRKSRISWFNTKTKEYIASLDFKNTKIPDIKIENKKNILTKKESTFIIIPMIKKERGRKTLVLYCKDVCLQKAKIFINLLNMINYENHIATHQRKRTKQGSKRFLKYLKNKRINGPVSFYYYPYQGKDIYLFGDMHFEKKGKCSNCYGENCMDISHFLFNYFTSQVSNTDLFLESPFIAREHHTEHWPTFHPGYLTDSLNWFQSCLQYAGNKNNIRYRTGDLGESYLNGCVKKYPTTFFHYPDIRKYLLDIYTALKGYAVHNSSFSSPDEQQKILNYTHEFFCQKAKTRTDLKKFVDLFIYSNNFKKDYFNFIGENYKEIINNGDFIDKHDQYRYFYSYSSGPHKIAKQIKKLRSKHRKKIEAFYERVWDKASHEAFQNFNKADYNQVAREFCNKPPKLINTFENSNFYGYIFLLGSTLTDFYTLSRMLYSIEKDPSSKEFIYYWGFAHIERFKDFFNQELGVKPYKVNSKQESLRCLKIN